MRGILISGYYGFGNSGDDALLMSIISDFKNKGLQDRITVLSANPAETKRVYGVNSINRINPFSLIYHLITCRLFISGGGTLIQDGTSTKSLVYYLTLIRLALFFGKKVMLYANGIGPVTKPANRKSCTAVLNRVNCITVRDEKSLEELKALKISSPEIKLTADPVFLLPADVASDKLQIPDGEYFCISVRNTKNLADGFADSVAEALDVICEKYSVNAVMLPLQAVDREISAKISSKMKNPAHIINERLTPHEIMNVVSHSCMCIGMRLHMLIYAAAVATPLVGIVYDPKVSGFMEYAKQKLFVEADRLTAENLAALTDRCMNERDIIKEELIREREKFRNLAGENTALAIKLYEERKH